MGRTRKTDRREGPDARARDIEPDRTLEQLVRLHEDMAFMEEEARRQFDKLDAVLTITDLASARRTLEATVLAVLAVYVRAGSPLGPGLGRAFEWYGAQLGLGGGPAGAGHDEPAARLRAMARLDGPGAVRLFGEV